MGLFKHRVCPGGWTQSYKSWRYVNMHLGDPKVLFIIWDGLFWGRVCVLLVVLYYYFTCRESINDRLCLHQCLGPTESFCCIQEEARPLGSPSCGAHLRVQSSTRSQPSANVLQELTPTQASPALSPTCRLPPKGLSLYHHYHYCR